MWPQYDFRFSWSVIIFAENWPLDRVTNFINYMLADLCDLHGAPIDNPFLSLVYKENKMAKKSKKDKNVMYRQGDVLLIRVDEHPKEAVKLPNVTVAYGEATGHHHTFERGAVLMELDEQVWVVATESAPLAHQEHETILVDPGIYRVQIQREYEPETGSRRVFD